VGNRTVHAPANDTLTLEEITAELAALSKANLVRLGRIARRYSMSPDDLLQDAFESIMEGNRHCPRDLNVMVFLWGTIRSLASSQKKSLAKLPVIDSLTPTTDDCDTHPDLDCPAVSPDAELLLISGQDADAIYSVLLSLFADDENAWLIVEGLMEGMERRELQELTGLGDTDYETKRRLIRRRINAKYPKGWKP